MLLPNALATAAGKPAAIIIFHFAATPLAARIKKHPYYILHMNKLQYAPPLAARIKKIPTTSAHEQS
jgi:hypothetical protein